MKRLRQIIDRQNRKNETHDAVVFRYNLDVTTADIESKVRLNHRRTPFLHHKDESIAIKAIIIRILEFECIKNKSYTILTEWLQLTLLIFYVTFLFFVRLLLLNYRLFLLYYSIYCSTVATLPIFFVIGVCSSKFHRLFFGYIIYCMFYLFITNWNFFLPVINYP